MPQYYIRRDGGDGWEDGHPVTLTGYHPNSNPGNENRGYVGPADNCCLRDLDKHAGDKSHVMWTPPTSTTPSGTTTTYNNTKVSGGNQVVRWLSSCSRRTFTRKTLYRRIPCLTQLTGYTCSKAIADGVAGLTVGLTAIPQSIAYANVAGLPPQYGLYSAFLGSFIYAIFGSCIYTPIGPTAIAAIITRENLHGLGPEFAVLLTFLCGCFILTMGILQLGFVIDFISGPVSAGFTSAAALIIATSQVKDILGLRITSSHFLEVWKEIFEKIHLTKPWDVTLGCICMLVLLLLRKAKDLPLTKLAFPTDIISNDNISQTSNSSESRRYLGKVIWFFSTSRNILVVLISALVAYLFDVYAVRPFVLLENVKSGFPMIEPPPFQAQVGNTTYYFVEMVSSIGSATFVVSLLLILEDIAIAKVFSDGKSVDATQEMLAIGACNIFSSFVSSMPVSGALSRAAVNHASGVSTTFGGVYTGILVLLSLEFLTPYLYYIPKASLAAVIIAAVIFMIEVQVIIPMWKTKKLDLVPAIATFAVCLFTRLEVGIVVGIAINIVFLLYSTARPTVRVEKLTIPSQIPSCDEYLLVTPDRSLVFPSTEYVRHLVSKAGIRQGGASIPVVFDAKHIQAVDYTAARGIKALIEDFVKRNQPILFIHVKPSVVESLTRGVIAPSHFQHCVSEIALHDTLKEYSQKTVNQPTRRTSNGALSH